MKVEIWSDIVCPWCYIGKQNFSAALRLFEHRDDVTVTWRSYELDTAAKKSSGMDSYDLIASKYGVSREESKQMHRNVTNRAAIAGLTYNMEKVIPTNSFDAHRLIHFAAAKGVQQDAIEKLFAAYFSEGKNISGHETLLDIAASLSLDRNEAREMLEGNAYAADVRADESAARLLRISGVPFFLFEGKYAISGAQPAETILETMQKIWMELNTA